jgi:short-subunit dehydrogenase
VVLAARSGDKLYEPAAQIPGSLALPVDMRKPEEIRKLVNRTHDAYGHVDILVNNAGQGMRVPVESIDIKDYKAIIELNVFGPLIAMQEVIPLMRKQDGGMILNVSSMLTKRHMPQLGAYSSTKYALNSLSFTARQELEKDGIVVSVFNPKMTATDFGRNARGEIYDSRAGRPGMGRRYC